MKLLPLLFIPLLLMSAGWRSDFTEAKQQALKEHKLVLLKFSGSDWCIPCIRMEKNLFSQQSFSGFADSNLVMVNADFPRQKKNKLSESVVKQNEILAEQYDKEGVFPLTILMDADGKVLKRWNGDPGLSPESFVAQIRTLQNAK